MTFALLIDNNKFEKDVGAEMRILQEGRVDNGIFVLKSRLSRGTEDLDTPPMRFFARRIELALEVLEGRRKTAFVNEMTPVITEPTRAWKHNLNTLVRGGLVVSLCPVRPSLEFRPVVCFAYRMRFLVEEYSPTARNVFSGSDSDKLESVFTGIFQFGEAVVSRDACGIIADDVGRLVRDWTWRDEDADVFHDVRHLSAIFDLAHSENDLAVLVGHI